MLYREKREALSRIKDELRSKGCDVLPDKKPEEHFDSNCITPVRNCFTPKDIFFSELEKVRDDQRSLLFRHRVLPSWRDLRLA